MRRDGGRRCTDALLRQFARRMASGAETDDGDWPILAAYLLARGLAGSKAVPAGLRRRFAKHGKIAGDSVLPLFDAPAWEAAWRSEGPYLLSRFYGVSRRISGFRDTVPGLHVTPPEIGRALVRKVLRRWERGNPGKVPRILDPACGSGAFLLWVMEELQRAPGLKARSLKTKTILWGVDIDRTGLEVCRLALAVAQKTSEIHAPVGCRVVRGDILSGDALSGDPDGFDIIVGNPPWVSLKGKHRAGGLSERELQRLVERYGASSYRPNLAELFVRRGWELLRPGGVLGLVVPDRIAANVQFQSLRRFLEERTRIVDLEFGVSMPGVISDVMTMVVEKGEPFSGHQVVMRSAGKISRVAQRDLAEWRWGEWRPPSIIQQPRWLEKTVPLGELIETAVGFIAKKGTITDRRVDPRQRKVVRGRDIVRFGRKKCGYFLFTKENLAGGTQDVRKLGASPKILVRKTGDRIVAALDESGDYPEQSLYFLFDPREDVRWGVLLAWLNSRTLGEYVTETLLTNRNSMAQLKKFQLDQIPVPVAFLGGEGFGRWAEKLERAARTRMRLTGGGPASNRRIAKVEAEIEELIVTRVGH